MPKEPVKRTPCPDCDETDYTEYICPECENMKKDCCQIAGNNTVCNACDAGENDDD